MKKTDGYALRESVKILAKAFRVVRDTLPGFVWMTSVNSLISSLRPVVTLFASAKILNELAGERDGRLIAAYAATAVVSVFLLSVVSSFVGWRLNTRNYFNYNKLSALYAKTYMQTDYGNTENNRVNQSIADIRARENGNGLGVIYITYSLGSLLGNIFTVGLSLALFSGMIASSGEYAKNIVTSPAASFFIAALAAVSVASPIFIRRLDKKAMEMTQRENPKANTLFWYYMEYKNVKFAAKDIRLYNQAETVSEILGRRLSNKMWIWFFRKVSLSSGLSGAVGALAGGLVY
ncbi:MAG: hypothetical protein FWF03_08900, partial [Defluviitaleaceae bacterium]|nr:hypothetical protein [Defluviitaleaceae bacterium]